MSDRPRPSVLPAWVLPAMASLFVLVPATGYLEATTPLADDASSHITTIATLAEAMRNGWGWWSPDYNAGFPMVLYYQPLPHIVSAAVAAAFGGSPAAPAVYKAFTVLLLAVQPWAMYAGMRRAGATDLAAAAAGAATPFVIAVTDPAGLTFGYNAIAALKIGLYTQDRKSVV